MKNNTETNRENYKTQRNFCKKLLQTSKKSYFDTLHTKRITDNKTFCKTMLSHFAHKVSKSE